LSFHQLLIYNTSWILAYDCIITFFHIIRPSQDTKILVACIVGNVVQSVERSFCD